MSLIVVSLAGSAGAVARYLVSGWVQESSGSDFPIGTMVVNVVGAFALGLVTGLGGLESGLLLAVAGFLGGFTTFSTWMIETVRLGLRSSRAVWNLALSVLGGVAAAAIGFILTG